MPAETDILNDEIKDLRNDFQRFRFEIEEKFKRVEISQAELKTQLNFSSRVAVLGITIIATTLITATSSGIWWATTINTKVDQIQTRFDFSLQKSGTDVQEIQKRLERLDSSLDRSESKLDALTKSLQAIKPN
jgi:peptidoglycan hydrolase CwlO-like protein